MYRLRVFSKDKRCPSCKTEMDTIIFAKDKLKRFDQYIQDMFIKAQIDKKNGILYDDIEIQQQIINWNKPKCDVCNTTFPTINLLENHLKSEHDRQFWFFIYG
jgi:hypothetical protein